MTTNSKEIYLLYGENFFKFQESVARLGRHLDNDFIIHDLKVSRFHAEIRYNGQDYILSDLDASYGTFVNNKEIKRHILKSGDSIALADKTILFLDGDSEEIKRTKIATGNLDKAKILEDTVTRDSQVKAEMAKYQAYLEYGNYVFKLTKRRVDIGRHLNNDYILNAPTLSRFHAQIKFVRGDFVLIDLSSSHGSYINQTRTERQILKSGDIISFAEKQVRFIKQDVAGMFTAPETRTVS